MSASISPAANTPSLEDIKRRQQATWATGNYAIVGTTLQWVGEQLCEQIDLRASSHVLDVAAGNGNASLAAARRFCRVESTDYVPELLAQGKQRADAEGLDITFNVADAENLPYVDRTFDIVVSTFGVMFAPDQARAANELYRVCQRGGKIGLANWTPTSFIGEVFKIVGRYTPPAPGLRSPTVWGTQEGLAGLFPQKGIRIDATVRQFQFRYPSAAHWLEIFRTYYGPVNRAFAAIDTHNQSALAADLLTLLQRCNRSGDKTLIVPSDYLEAVIHVK